MASDIPANLITAIFALVDVGLPAGTLVEVEETWNFVGKERIVARSNNPTVISQQPFSDAAGKRCLSLALSYMSLG
jgi:hypothetical protein